VRDRWKSFIADNKSGTVFLLLGLRPEQRRLVENGSILASLLPLRFGDSRR
jgi:hypothetical protein